MKNQTHTFKPAAKIFSKGFAAARNLLTLTLFAAGAGLPAYGSAWSQATSGTQDTYVTVSNSTADTSESYSFNDDFTFVHTAGSPAEVSTTANSVWIFADVWSQNNGGLVGIYKDDFANSYSSWSWTGTPGAALPVTNRVIMDFTGFMGSGAYYAALSSGTSADATGITRATGAAFVAGTQVSKPYEQVVFGGQSNGGTPGYFADVDDIPTVFTLSNIIEGGQDNSGSLGIRAF